MRLTLTDLKKVRRGLEKREYNHAMFGVARTKHYGPICGCVLGEVAKVKRLVSESGFYRGYSAKDLLESTPALRRFKRTINILHDGSAEVDKPHALKIVDRFIAAMRRYRNAAR